MSQKAQSHNMPDKLTDLIINDTSRKTFVIYEQENETILGVCSMLLNYSNSFYNLKGNPDTFSGTYSCASYIEKTYRRHGIYSQLKNYCLQFANNYSADMFYSITGSKKLNDNPIPIDKILSNIRLESINAFHWGIHRNFKIIGYSMVHSGPLLKIESNHTLVNSNINI